MKPWPKITGRLCMLISFGMVVVSCTPATAIPASPTKVLITASSTPTPTAEYNRLPTAKLPPTLVPTPVPVINSPIVVEGSCIELETTLPADLPVSGVWLRNPGAPRLDNIKDDARYSIPFKGNGLLMNGINPNMAISPDGRLLAYMDGFINKTGYGTDKWEFRIVKSDGQLLALKNWGYDTRRILGWVSNSEIVLEVYSRGIKYLVYNPATGATREILIDLGIVPPNNTWEKEIESGVNYFNPDEIVLNAHDGIILYNVEGKSKIFVGVNFGYMAQHAWSPDLSTLLIDPFIDGETSDLYAIRDNKVLLQLNAIKTGMSDHPYEAIRGFGWSPDSKMFLIASYGGRVAIMHLDTLKLTALCINNGKGFEESWWYARPVWSPDSRFLVFNNGIQDVLIDVERMRAFALPSSRGEYDRLGWLAAP